MKCDQCGAQMVNVGRMIKPGRSEIWEDGYVCPKRRCPGYALHFYDGSVPRWPAATLSAGISVHARILGAIKFRDA